MNEIHAASNNNVINSVSPCNAMQDASMASPWQFPYSSKQVVKCNIQSFNFSTIKASQHMQSQIGKGNGYTGA